jgi:hypothetical protein
MPDIDPQRANDEQLELFDEDLLQMVDPTGTYIIDVGWYPAGSREGHFVCRVVRSDDWEWPLHQIETSNAKLVWQWLKKQVAEVRDMVGATGSFATKVGFFLYRRPAKRSGKRKASGLKQQVVPTLMTAADQPANNPTTVHRMFSERGPTPRTTNPSSNAAIAIKLPRLPELAHAT